MRKSFIASIIVVLSMASVLFLTRTGALQEVSYFFRNAELGSAYVASELCYGIFLQGRTEETIRARELGPFIDDRLSWYRARIDKDRGEVSTSLLGLFRQSWGQRTDGSCSANVHGEGSERQFDSSPDPRPWPEGDALHPLFRDLVLDHDALVEAVEAEFRPLASGRDRGTRSVLIIHNGHLVHERHADGWNRLLPQNGHSNTKVVNSILAGILSRQGRLSLDDSMLRPEWTDNREAIQLRHLLHMESGLDWQEVSGADDSGYAKLLSFSASAYAAAKDLRDDPGARYFYSGGDSELAMSVLQGRSGLDAGDWARYPYEVLFVPLGMHRTVLDRGESGEFIGQGSMYAAPVDWARLGLLLARGGVWNGERILPEGWVDFTATPTERSGCNYGAQLWIRGGCSAGRPSRVFKLSGFMGQGVSIVPETETVIVRLGFGPWNMGDLLERVFPALGVDAPTRMAMEKTP